MAATKPQRKSVHGGARVLTANRSQPEFGFYDIDGLLPLDHRARTLWAAVERMELSPFYASIKARDGGQGRPALDPKVLLALWLFATSEGVGSARHLSRLCERDHAYMWLCGGLKPNYHDLSDFRVGHAEKLDALLTQLLASLMAAGILKLRRVAQDGTRVRAHAGAASFRRASTLRERCLVDAKEQVEALRREVEEEPAASSNREASARERAARERQAAVERALQELPKVIDAHERTQKKRESKAKKKGEAVDEKKSEPRVSTTDAEARVMKMADGGFRPAYNMQSAIDTETRIVVGVDVTNEGSDRSQLGPMFAQILARTGLQPEDFLVDGGYTNLEAIDAVEAKNTRVYAPVPKPRTKAADPYARKPNDTPRTAAWRARMKTDEAKRIYGERAATIEPLHADLRTWRGLRQMPVRGRDKVLAIARLHVLTYNLLRADVLRRQA